MNLIFLIHKTRILNLCTGRYTNWLRPVAGTSPHDVYESSQPREQLSCTKRPTSRRPVSVRLNSTTRTRPDPRGPARTLSETRTVPTEFLGDLGRKKVRAGPVEPV